MWFARALRMASAIDKTHLNRRLLSLTAAIFVSSSPGAGQVVDNRCPWNGYGQSWYKYFNIPSSNVTAYIVLNNTDDIPNDTRWKNACFRLSIQRLDTKTNSPVQHYGYSGYIKERPGYVMFSNNPYGSSYSWHVYQDNGIGTYGQQPFEMPFPRFDKFEIVIINDILVFNEGGEIYHRQFGRVGRLQCNPPYDEPCLTGKVQYGQSYW
jgi:hypothetical protein